MKKNMRRLTLRVTAQTLYNLERLRQMGELRDLGRVVDKLVREKMISLHKDHVNAVKPGAPLTQEELNTMHFDRVWIFYPPQYDGDRGSYEDGVVLYGRLYSLETLEGAGFEELLQDAMDGETLDRPTGEYQVFRHLVDCERADHFRKPTKMVDPNKKGAQKWIMKRSCEQR